MIPVGIAQHVLKLKYVVNSNSTTILTAVGVTGTVATAVLTGRATFKAAEVIGQSEATKVIGNATLRTDGEGIHMEGDLLDSYENSRLSKLEKVRLVWPHYIPAVAVGGVTIASIVLAHRISSKQIAALGLAAGVSERAFQEYKDKVVEKFGERKDTTIRDEIAQEHVTANPPAPNQVIITGAGDVLCYDDLTGRYFHSNVEKIKAAENNVNYSILQDDYCSLSYFFDEIGLKPTTYSDMVGWNVNTRMEVRFSATMTEDSRPCMVLGYVHAPEVDYDKVWCQG